MDVGQIPDSGNWNYYPKANSSLAAGSILVCTLSWSIYYDCCNQYCLIGTIISPEVSNDDMNVRVLWLIGQHLPLWRSATYTQTLLCLITDVLYMLGAGEGHDGGK